MQLLHLTMIIVIPIKDKFSGAALLNLAMLFPSHPAFFETHTSQPTVSLTMTAISAADKDNQESPITFTPNQVCTPP